MQTQYITDKKIKIIILDSSRSKKTPFVDKKILSGLKKVAAELEFLLFSKSKMSLGLNPKLVESVELSVNFCGRKQMQHLNLKYRKIDKITDVLSFAMHSNLREREKFNKNFNLKNLNLGDLVICREVAIKQSAQFSIPLHSEIIHLAIHGILHLCGLDHDKSSKEKKIMDAYEDYYTQKIIGKY